MPPPAPDVLNQATLIATGSPMPPPTPPPDSHLFCPFSFPSGCAGDRRPRRKSLIAIAASSTATPQSKGLWRNCHQGIPSRPTARDSTGAETSPPQSWVTLLVHLRSTIVIRFHSMGTLPPLILLLWAIETIVQLTVLSLVVAKRHVRTLPLFFLYIALNLCQAAFLFFVYSLNGFTSPAARQLSWLSEQVILTAQALAAAEVLYRVLRHYAGIWALAWRLIVAAAVIVICYASASAGLSPHRFPHARSHSPGPRPINVDRHRFPHASSYSPGPRPINADRHRFPHASSHSSGEAIRSIRLVLISESTGHWRPQQPFTNFERALSHSPPYGGLWSFSVDKIRGVGHAERERNRNPSEPSVINIYLVHRALIVVRFRRWRLYLL